MRSSSENLPPYRFRRCGTRSDERALPHRMERSSRSENGKTPLAAGRKPGKFRPLRLAARQSGPPRRNRAAGTARTQLFHQSGRVENHAPLPAGRRGICRDGACSPLDQLDLAELALHLFPQRQKDPLGARRKLAGPRSSHRHRRAPDGDRPPLRSGESSAAPRSPHPEGNPAAPYR